MLNLLIFVLVVLIWLFLIRMFHKLNMLAFKFFTGSIGLFLITITFFRELLEILMGKLLFIVLSAVTTFTGLFEAFGSMNTVLINTPTGFISMNLTYECSGVIEILVFLSLAIFFPFRSNFKKIFLTLLGFLLLITSNIIRIIFIASISKIFGISIYPLTHMVLARILFFVLTISIYYIIFTKTHLKEYIFGGVTVESPI
ncbi:MAG: exosortase family protein XrtG [Sarcina sp.]